MLISQYTTKITLLYIIISSGEYLIIILYQYINMSRHYSDDITGFYNVDKSLFYYNRMLIFSYFSILKGL